MKKLFLLIGSHLAAALLGFVAGIYLLPILIAPAAPPVSEVRATAVDAQFSGQFRRNLAGSDALHWGEGTVFVGNKIISLEGKIAPGPDYKLYLSPQFVETEADFNRLKSTMVRVGDVKTFQNFIVYVPESIDPNAFTSVIVWCESFGQFITAAKYR
jgi:hypothetical protein